MTERKILILDIEWKPTKAYVWRPWKENITPEKIIEHGGLLCVGFKWYGKQKTSLVSEWKHGLLGMLEAVHKAMSEADAIVTYNGDKYDLPKLSGEFLRACMDPPPPCASIDVIKTVKKQGFFMNRLAFVAPYLGLQGKLKHSGMRLWVETMEGKRSAQRLMARYCKQDVVVLEELYEKTKPFIKNHPHLGDSSPRECPTCGSSNVQSRGFRRTRNFRIQRLHCQDCGSWHQGTRSKV